MNNEQARTAVVTALVSRGFGKKHAEKKSILISRTWVPSCLTIAFTPDFIANCASRTLRDEIAEFGRIRGDEEIKPLSAFII